jgi:hypothetical protein
MHRRSTVIGLVLSLMAFVLPAWGAAPAEDSWLALQGCWRASDAAPGNLLCIVPAGAGVRMIELANGEIVRESRMVADGRERALSQEDCAGAESVRWSDDGRRVYLNTRMSCGTEIARNSTGLFALISPREWVSIQALEVDQEAAIRSVQYTLVDAPTNVPEWIVSALRSNRLARETARYHASSALALADIQEACQRVHGRAVEALIVARNQSFTLEGKQLLALLDAGVPSYLIDALVAVSNPQRFAVRQTDLATLERHRANDHRAHDDRDYRGRYCDDFDLWYSRYCDPYYSRYSTFGTFWRYGHRDYGYRSPPVIVVVDPDRDRDDKKPKPHGRVTKRGYTNGSSNTSSNTRDTDRSATSTRESDRSTTSTRSSSDGSSSSRATSSTPSSGSSSSSSSSSSDRGKAKPRGGTD